jgi:hypothetical protein
MRALLRASMRTSVRAGVGLRSGLALLAVALLAGAAAAPAGAEPPLRVRLWVDRGAESTYFPGESVWVTFTVNGDAYVCLYNIDTTGRVQVLFPPPGDPGLVRAHEVIELPGPDCDFDYVIAGPPGIETIEAIACRAHLAPWNDGWDEEWETEDWDERGFGPGDGRDRDEDATEEWDEEGPPRPESDGWEEGIGGREMRLEARPLAPPRVTGIQVAGDPFVAIRRVNRRLLPAPCSARDYDTAVLTFYVGRRVAYPRYACNDCHGFYHGYDPYGDRCAVFSVRVNSGWVYAPHHVVVHDVHVIEPRYIYVRHAAVPPRYKNLKRAWPSHDRYKIRKEFRDSPAWTSVEKPGASWSPAPRVPSAGAAVRWKERTTGAASQETAPRIKKPRKESGPAPAVREPTTHSSTPRPSGGAQKTVGERNESHPGAKAGGVAPAGEAKSRGGAKAGGAKAGGGTKAGGGAQKR